VGRQFECTYHIYSKKYEGKRGKKKTMNVRDEMQEYPNKPLEEAFMDKLKDDDDSENYIRSRNLI
jgi:hypothetical protein